MTKFSKNKIKAKGDVNIHIGDEINYGTEYEKYSAEGLLEEKPRKEQQVKNRKSELRKKNIKWWVSFVANVLVIVKGFIYIWDEMGNRFSINALVDTFTRAMFFEKGNLVLFLKIFLPFVPILSLIIFAFLITRNFAFNDETYLRHTKNLKKIKDEIEDRGLK